MLPGVGEVLRELQRMRELLEQQTRAQFPSPVAAPWFLRMGGKTVPISGSDVLLTVTPPAGTSGVVTAMGTSADTWSDGAIPGILLDVTLGGVPFDNLVGMDSAYGVIGERSPVWIPFVSNAAFGIRARNTDAAATHEACAQVSGFFYTTLEGLPPLRTGQGMVRPTIRP